MAYSPEVNGVYIPQRSFVDAIARVLSLIPGVNLLRQPRQIINVRTDHGTLRILPSSQPDGEAAITASGDAQGLLDLLSGPHFN